MTPAELDRFFEELRGWASARSASATTVTYGDHADQVLDLYRPASGDGAVLALVLHGGFWRAPYTRRNTVALAVGLCEQGWPAANVEYRRLGPGRYRPMLDDVRSARERLASFAQVVAVGHSAGGQLALWLAAEGVVDAAVTLGGVCDLGAAAAQGLGGDAVVELLGASPVEAPVVYREVDPAARLPLGRPHVLVHGLHDDRVPVDHARAYAAQARGAGDDCRLLEVDADHFMPIDPRSGTWPTVVAAVSSLLRELEGAATP
jgi:acetyl esterase/lipase